MRKTRLMTAVAIASAGVVLSACNGTAPGVAVQVGDTRYTIDEVDALADDFCASNETMLEQQEAAVPMGIVRRKTVELLSYGALADLLAEEYDLTVGPDFDALTAQVEGDPALAEVPADERAVLVDLFTSDGRLADLLNQATLATLAERGVEEPTQEEFTQVNTEISEKLLAEHEIEIDPRYGLTSDGDLPVPADTGVSYAVSDVAKAARTEQGDVDYARSLPAGQRCG